MLEDLGFEDVAVTHRYDSFDGTSKVHIARKFGVIGVNVIARAAAKEEEEESSDRDSWVGRIKRAAARIAGKKVDATIGARAPDFTLPLAEGEGAVRLGEQSGHPVLLMFLPTDWCPVCHACMRVYRDNAPLMRRHGVRLVIVTPEVTAEVRQFARGLETEHVIALDAEHAVASLYGAAQRSKKTDETTLLPISFFIDTKGRVKCRSELDTAALCVNDLARLVVESAD